MTKKTPRKPKKAPKKAALDMEKIRVALGADEAIQLETDPNAGPLAVAAEAMAIRRSRAAKSAIKRTAPDDEAMKAAPEKAVKERPAKRPELPPLSSPPTPQEVDKLLYAFPACVIGTLLPEQKAIPRDVPRVWSHFVEYWFACLYTGKGLPADIEFHAKAGFSAEKAYRHIDTCMRSYQPKHEHKTAGCAYLASCFFAKVSIPSEKKEFEPA